MISYQDNAYKHGIGWSIWHFEWVTKYRYNMFSKFEYKNLCEACIRKVATLHNIKIHIISVMPNHIYTLVTLPKGMSEDKAMQLLKGASAYLFFRNHLKARLR